MQKSNQFNFLIYQEKRQRELTERMFFLAVIYGALPFAAVFTGFYLFFKDTRLLLPVAAMACMVPLILYTCSRLKREKATTWVWLSCVSINVLSAAIWLAIKDIYFTALLPALFGIVLGNLILPKKRIIWLGAIVSAFLVGVIVLHYFEIVIPFVLPPLLHLGLQLGAATILTGVFILSLYISMGLNEEYTNRLVAANENQSAILAQINKLFTRIHEIIEDLRLASKQLNELVQRQATALSEMSSAQSQILSMTEQGERSAKAMQNGYESSLGVTREGRLTNQRSAAEVDRIKKELDHIRSTVESFKNSSERIDGFIATIGNLADNSKVLSVNASIEAAKAGKFGAGFNVVSHEMQLLAQESKSATNFISKTISELDSAISTAIKVSRDGSSRVDASLVEIRRLGEYMEQLAQVIEDSSEIATRVANSATQQSVGISQINVGMQEIDSAMSEAHNTAQTVEHSSKELRERSQQLLDMLQKIQI